MPEYSLAEKQRARSLVSRLIKQGVIVRPNACSACQRTCKPRTHHPDYGRPSVVVFLCTACHRKEHPVEPRPKMEVEIIPVRMTKGMRKRWKAAAADAGMGLSAWIRRAGDRALEIEDKLEIIRRGGF